MKTVFEASAQKGKPGHCFAAQVFKNGKAFITVDPTDDENEATNSAKEIAEFLNNKNQSQPIEEQYGEFGRLLVKSEKQEQEIERLNDGLEAVKETERNFRDTIALDRKRIKKLEAQLNNYKEGVEQMMVHLSDTEAAYSPEEAEEMIEKAMKVGKALESSPTEQPEAQKQLTEDELQALSSVGIIAKNWYAVTYHEDQTPFAMFDNEEYAKVYRDQFCATAVIVPYPMQIKDYRKQQSQPQPEKAQEEQSDLWGEVLHIVEPYEENRGPIVYKKMIDCLNKNFTITRKQP